MALLRKCCCCVDLRRGGIAIGIVAILLALLQIVVDISRLVVTLKRGEENPQYEIWELVTSIIVALVIVISSFFMIYGAINVRYLTVKLVSNRNSSRILHFSMISECHKVAILISILVVFAESSTLFNSVPRNPGHSNRVICDGNYPLGHRNERTTHLRLEMADYFLIQLLR